MDELAAVPDTVVPPKGGPRVQRGRTLQDIIVELNDTYFFSYRRYRLKKEFLEQLRNPRVIGNVVLLEDSVLAALLKYVSADDRQEILEMTRTNGESALPFAIAHRIHGLQKIKLLVEEFKAPVKPEWVSLREEDREIKLYLQQHTPLYAAAQKKDVDGFKIALKKQDVNLTEYVDHSIVDFIQSKIRENQGRNAVFRYFLNRKWNRMLRAATGQIKKQLLKQAENQKTISAELLSLLNQCPPEEIYYALQWYSQDDARLYNKLKILDLSEYSNISSQMEKIASEEVEFGLVRRISKVPSNLKIVSKTGAPVVQHHSDEKVEQVQLPVVHESDGRTRFHQYIREGSRGEILLMLRQQLVSEDDVQEVLSINSQMDIDDEIKAILQSEVERLQSAGNGAKKSLVFG